ncbi:MAG: DJ-1/PfpI family protein [bacterium]|nr:DJ-1/PfpI family protein [bacterium]
MSKVYVFLADGFEEVEALSVVDLLRRADVDTTMIAVSDTIEIIGGHGIVVTADKVFEEVSFEEADMIFLPGGTTGVKNLAKCEELCDKIVEFNQEGKMVVAICAAPTLLHKLGILDGKNATCYRDLASELTNTNYIDANVVVDGNVITSQGFGTSVDLGLALIEHFRGRDEAKRIQNAVMYRA